MAADKMLLRRIATALESHSYRFSSERQLHNALASVLDAAGVRYEREHIAGPRDRFDFLCEGGIVIEAKIKGSLPNALRQIDRYCEREEVSAVILVATRAWARSRALKPDAALHGKPIRMVHLRSQAF